MKRIHVESAAGMELCHEVTAMRGGFKGVAFKRGRIVIKAGLITPGNGGLRQLCKACR